MKIYAHRTARGLVAENTLEGCALSLELGVDYIDLDIGITKDGVLVVTHDEYLNPDLTRDANGNYIIKNIHLTELTFKELQQFTVGKINPNSPYAAYFPDQKAVPHAKIPSLRAVIDFLKNTTVNYQIEMKTEGMPITRFAETLNLLLKETNSIERTEVQSFDLSLLKKLDPSIKTSYVTKGEKFSPAWNTPCWSVYQMDLTEEEVQRAKSHGIKTIAWGYPEEEGTEFNGDQIKKLLNWGVDGIITDRPDKLLNLLNTYV